MQPKRALLIQHSNPTIGIKERNSLLRALQIGFLSEGIITQKLENGLKKFIGTKYGIATNSGTSALHLSLLSLDVDKDIEVIIPSFVCTSVLNAINYIGAKPVICDIELDSFNLSLEDTKRKVKRKTKAIVLPYMFGNPAEIDKFLELDIPIIEDCAQSLGATYKSRKLGGFGIASIFSFYATKVIATGQGGMVLTNSHKIFNKVKDLIEYDERNDYKVRYNYKMTDIQAALGLVQLKRINAFIERRREIARYYNTMFSKYDIIIPIRDPGHIYYRYVIRINASVKKFIQRLGKIGIEAKPPVFKPLHRYLGLDKKLFPNTEKIFKTAVSIPIYPSLTDNQIRFIARSVLEAL